MDAAYYVIQRCSKCRQDSTFRPDEGSEDLFCENCGTPLEGQ